MTIVISQFLVSYWITHKQIFYVPDETWIPRMLSGINKFELISTKKLNDTEYEVTYRAFHKDRLFSGVTLDMIKQILNEYNKCEIVNIKELKRDDD